MKEEILHVFLETEIIQFVWLWFDIMHETIFKYAKSFHGIYEHKNFSLEKK